MAFPASFSLDGAFMYTSMSHSNELENYSQETSIDVTVKGHSVISYSKPFVIRQLSLKAPRARVLRAAPVCSRVPPDDNEMSYRR